MLVNGGLTRAANNEQDRTMATTTTKTYNYKSEGLDTLEDP